MKNQETAKRKTDELVLLYQQGIEKVKKSGEFQKYLRTMASFSSYSMRNTMLIYAQKPDASYVAGYRKWIQLGRHVRKGEKGIRICAPRIIKNTQMDSPEQEEKQLIAYRSVCVFDISQTEGKPLMEPPIVLLQGETALYSQAISMIESLTGYEVEEKTMPDGSCGRTVYNSREITINSSLSEVHRLKTLIHEAGHALLHSCQNEASEDDPILRDQRMRETEAEGVAYVVCQALGIDTSSYSFAYAALYQKLDCSILEQSLERISKTSRMILESFEKSCIQPAKESESAPALALAAA